MDAATSKQSVSEWNALSSAEIKEMYGKLRVFNPQEQSWKCADGTEFSYRTQYKVLLGDSCSGEWRTKQKILEEAAVQLEKIKATVEEEIPLTKLYGESEWVNFSSKQLASIFSAEEVTTMKKVFKTDWAVLNVECREG